MGKILGASSFGLQGTAEAPSPFSESKSPSLALFYPISVALFDFFLPAGLPCGPAGLCCVLTGAAAPVLQEELRDLSDSSVPGSGAAPKLKFNRAEPSGIVFALCPKGVNDFP